jgi:hypothetical protein
MVKEETIYLKMVELVPSDGDACRETISLLDTIPDIISQFSCD